MAASTHPGSEAARARRGREETAQVALVTVATGGPLAGVLGSARNNVCATLKDFFDHDARIETARVILKRPPSEKVRPGLAPMPDGPRASSRGSNTPESAILDAALDCIVTIDDQGRVTEFNKAAESTFGYRREEVLGRDLADLIIPSTLREQHRGGFARYLMRVLGKRVEMRAIRADGSEFPVELAITRIPSKGPPSFIGILRDITERHQSIAERKWAETQLAGDKQLLEMVATGRSLRHVLNALCSFVEEAAIGCYCGVYPIDWSGPTFEYGVAPSLPASYTDPIKGLPVRNDIAPCGIAAFEKKQVVVPDIDLDPRWARTPYQAHVLAHGLRSVWSTPISSLEGSVLGTFCVYQRNPADPSPRLQSLIAQVTHIASIAIERSRAEEAFRELELVLARMNRVSMMGELAASLSHEITQPIGSARNNVLGALNFLDRQPADMGEVREALASAVGDANRAGEIIDRIRDHIRKAPPRKTRFDLNSAVDEVIALARSAIAKNEIVVQTALAEGLPSVKGDRVQLQQVILNLVLNAVEAMGAEAGARELLISTEQTGGNGFLVAVRDSGPGIDPARVERVFDAFYTTKSGGVGMGLSICRSIIDAHGGRLWADMNKPRGAVFQFTLPGG